MQYENHYALCVYKKLNAAMNGLALSFESGSLKHERCRDLSDTNRNPDLYGVQFGSILDKL